MLRVGVLRHDLCAVMLWDREIVDDDPPPPEGYEGWSSSLKTTRAGDLALIYATGHDQAIAQLILFTENAEPDCDWRYGAQGRIAPVIPEVKREELLRIPDLAPMFAHLQGRRNLPEQIADALLIEFPQLADAYERLTDIRPVVELRQDFTTTDDLAECFFEPTVCAQFGLSPGDRGRSLPGCRRRTEGLSSEGTSLVAFSLRGKRRSVRALLGQRAVIEEHLTIKPDAHLIVGGPVSNGAMAEARSGDVQVWHAAVDDDGDLWLQEL